MSQFCDRFRQLKKESGLTLRELSERLDVTIPNLSYYMKEREPSFDTLVKIADEFNVSTDWLLGRVDEVALLRKENEDLRKKLDSILEIVTK